MSSYMVYHFVFYTMTLIFKVKNVEKRTLKYKCIYFDQPNVFDTFVLDSRCSSLANVNTCVNTLIHPPLDPFSLKIVILIFKMISYRLHRHVVCLFLCFGYDISKAVKTTFHLMTCNEFFWFDICF